jgi:hypothetical protein
VTTPTAVKVHTDKDTGVRHYSYPPTGEPFVSVTTVTGGTEAKQQYLVPWAARLAAEYAVDNPDLIAKTIETEGRQAAVDLVKDQARKLRELKADTGKYVHAVAEALILWAASPAGTGGDIVIPTLPDHLVGADYDDQPLDDVSDWMITGFTNFVSAFNPRFEATEMVVFNPALKVAGTLDMIIVLVGYALTTDGRLIPAPGNLLVLCVDIKTGKRLDITTREQIATYRRMTEALMPMGELVAMPATDAAAVLHLRPEFPDGYRLMPISPADDAKAWNRFRRAADIYHGRAEINAKPGKVAYPLRPDGTMPTPRLADLDGEGYGRALGALIKAGLTDLDDVAALTAAQLLDIKGIGVKTAGTVRRMLTGYGFALADENTPIGEVA